MNEEEETNEEQGWCKKVKYENWAIAAKKLKHLRTIGGREERYVVKCDDPLCLSYHLSSGRGKSEGTKLRKSIYTLSRMYGNRRLA